MRVFIETRPAEKNPIPQKSLYETMLTSSLIFLIFFGIFAVAAKAQDFVGSVRGTLEYSGIPAAESVLKQYRDARGITPEYLEAYSWLGRKALQQRDYALAEKYAKQTYEMSTAELKHRSLDSEPHLPIALGAAIEVEGQSIAAQDDRAGAVAYLRSEEQKYANTSIAARIQKNINLLSLEGKLAPALHETEYLGPKPQPLTAYKGRQVLLFFWAHWCGECKAEVPIVAQLKAEYGDKLVVLGPTQRYGYGAAGEPMDPASELRYIDAVRTKYYARLADMPVPVSADNSRRYGVSTTPTLVIVGADGKVKLYHPGRMTYEELKAALSR
jgi:thiol-disulfide isomerase/thioredoxin